MMLSVRDVAYNGYIPVPNPKMRWYATLPPVNCDLEFGKVYHVVSEHENELWAFNWLLAGIFNPQQGSFSLDGVVLDDRLQRRKIAWLVGYYDEIRRFGRFRQTVKNQVRQGIKKYHAHNLSEYDYLSHFYLTPQRYVRYLGQQSNEHWRSSCVIGVAHNKMIFCFPAHLNQYFIDAFHYLWVDMLQFMKSLNCLILIPSPTNTNMYNLCDEVIHI